MFDNQRLQQAVSDELRFDPSLADDQIKVHASSGAVRLTGSVPSYAQKRLAAHAAQRIGAVREVTDELVVRLPSTIATTDAEIAERAMQTLAWDVSCPQQVRATVDKGVITLTGQAEHRFEKAAAETAVGRLFGVTGIANKIIVQPTEPPATGFQDSIGKALDRFGFQGADVKVTAEGGKVFLKGTVANARQREMAEHAAWSVPGVTAVDERLTVN